MATVAVSPAASARVLREIKPGISPRWIYSTPASKIFTTSNAAIKRQSNGRSGPKTRISNGGLRGEDRPPLTGVSTRGASTLIGVAGDAATVAVTRGRAFARVASAVRNRRTSAAVSVPETPSSKSSANRPGLLRRASASLISAHRTSSSHQSGILASGFASDGRSGCRERCACNISCDVRVRYGILERRAIGQQLVDHTTKRVDIAC